MLHSYYYVLSDVYKSILDGSNPVIYLKTLYVVTWLYPSLYIIIASNSNYYISFCA